MTTKVTINRYPMYYTHTFGDLVTSSASMALNCDTTRVGGSLPGWRDRIASLQSATTDYSVIGRTLETRVGSIVVAVKHRTTGATTEAKLSGNWLTTPATLAWPGHDTSVSGAAAAKFYSRVGEALAPFKGLVFLGEMRESLGLIATQVRRIYTAFHKTRAAVKRMHRALLRRLAGRRRRRGPSPERDKVLIDQLLGNVSNLWLEWSFGVQPLLGDIESLAEARMRPRSEVRRIRSRETTGRVLLLDSTSKGWLYQNTGSYYIRSLQWRESSTRCFGSVKCEYPGGNNPLQGSAERYGLTFREFVPTLWELTPWSFLVDYFLNVGHVLNAGAYHTADIVYACKSSFTTVEWRCSAKPGVKGAEFDLWVPVGDPTGGWDGREIAFQLNRSPLAITDVGFRLTYPPMGTKYANMVALLVSKLTKGAC